MTVFPLPEQNNEKKEKLLDDAILPPAVVTSNKTGYTPVSTLAAASARAQRRLRSFRRLMIVLMVIGLLIIAVALAYGLYKGISYKMNNHRNLHTSSHVHHSANSMYHTLFRGLLSDADSNKFKPLIEEDADIDENSRLAILKSKAIFHDGNLFREANIVHLFSARLTIIQDNDKDSCFIKPSGLSSNPEEVQLRSMFSSKFIPELQTVRKTWYAKPLIQVQIARLHPQASKFCIGRITYQLVQTPNPDPIPAAQDLDIEKRDSQRVDAIKQSFACLTRQCPSDAPPCQYGKKKDSYGCETCECLTQTESQALLDATECPQPNCIKNCIWGFKTDAHGCSTCDCITAADRNTGSMRKKREAGCVLVRYDGGFLPTDSTLELDEINICN